MEPENLRYIDLETYESLLIDKIDNYQIDKGSSELLDGDLGWYLDEYDRVQDELSDRRIKVETMLYMHKQGISPVEYYDRFNFRNHDPSSVYIIKDDNE